MSYEVLARKYRPSSFEEVVGQEHVIQALSNSIFRIESTKLSFFQVLEALEKQLLEEFLLNVLTALHQINQLLSHATNVLIVRKLS